MYLLYSEGLVQESILFEDKKEAYEAAKTIAAEHSIIVKIYKANLVAVAETAVTINKIRKQRKVKAAKVEVEEPEILDIPDHIPQAVIELTKRNYKRINRHDQITEEKPKKVVPVLAPELIEIAEDTSIPNEEEEIPVGARCALDRNMAVGKKRGPTGEFVYLCLDCMGAITNG